MIELDVPGLGMLALKHLALDLNGTIALDGQVLPGLAIGETEHPSGFR